MKRTQKTVLRTLPPVRMYWDDVEALAEIIEETGQIKISSDGFEYESLAELQSAVHRDYIRTLGISSSGLSGESVMANIEPGKVYLHIGPEAESTGARAREFLLSRTPWFTWTSGSWPWIALEYTASFLLWVAAIFTTFVLLSDHFWVFLVVAFLVGAVVWVPFWIEPLVGRTRIYLARRGEHRPFWQRNRDAILVNAIVAAVSVVLGFLLGQFLP